MRKALSVALATFTLMAAAACGTTAEPGMDMNQAPNAGETEQGTGQHNAADVMFAQMMIPHHEQAIEMAALAESRSQNSEVLELAKKIEGAQDPEITQMEGWLSSWGDEPMGMDHGGGHGAMRGMMDGDTMAALEKAQGPAFDKLFLESMIEHHEGAIEMAEDEKSKGKYGPALELADAIIKGQSAEITQMRKMLEG